MSEEQTGAMTAIAERARADGWENVVLGLGGTKDPSAYTTFGSRAQITDVVLEALYVEDHFAAKLIEALPNYVLRAGWDLQISGDPRVASDARKAYAGREEDIGTIEELAQGAWWGRLFGGALTWVGADDGRQPEIALDEKGIASIRFLHTFDRRDVVIHGYYTDPEHPKFQKPETYRVVPRTGGLAGIATADGGGVVLHESRCLVWPGQPTTDTRRLFLRGWDDSILERCWDALKQVAEGFGGSSLLLGRVSQSVYKIKNLYKMIAGKEEATLRTRMALLEASRSRSRAILLDPEEDYVNVAQPLAGVDALLDRALLRLSSAADMPVTVLMGQSPAGMDATGESDQENWEAQGKRWRELVFRPRHERLAKLMLLAKDGPTNGIEPEQWTMAYRPLREPRPKERAEVRKLEAETDATNIDKGVYTADVAAYRYGPSGAAGVVLDEKELEDRAKRRRDLQNQPPKDNAELGTVGARSSAALELVEKVHAKTLPRESGKALLIELFRFTDTVAESILGPATFEPASAPAKNPGPAPDPKSGQGAGAPPNPTGFNDGGGP
jgi:phage-related protein (TIGR01555 family)